MKHFLTALLLASVLLVTGCADPYYEKLEDLEYRVAELQKTCDQINSDLLALQSLVSAIEKKDMITGVTELRSGTTLLGYRINFVDHAAVTISNGKDGNKPLVASQRDPEDGNWYWTVQYGDGTAEWLLAPDGSKMLSIGVLPYVTIRDGWFCYTAIQPLDDGTVLLGYCAYDLLAHSRLVKVPLNWFYEDSKYIMKVEQR